MQTSFNMRDLRAEISIYQQEEAKHWKDAPVDGGVPQPQPPKHVLGCLGLKPVAEPWEMCNQQYVCCSKMQ